MTQARVYNSNLK